MLVAIFRALEKMHRQPGWDDSAAEVFGKIADFLEQNSVMPI